MVNNTTETSSDSDVVVQHPLPNTTTTITHNKNNVDDDDHISSNTNTNTTLTSQTTVVDQPLTRKTRTIVQRVRRRRPDPSSHNNSITPSSMVLDTDYIQTILKASNLPIHVYSFEIERTIQRCCLMILQQQQEPPPKEGEESSTLHFHIALQMPEGLLLYATVLVDVLQKLIIHHYHHVKHPTSCSSIRPLEVEMSILSDVTYGACCIDDITAALMKCHLLIHYGHSCLVPIQHTVIPVHYVFVEIQFYIPHCVDTIYMTLFPPVSSRPPALVQSSMSTSITTTTTMQLQSSSIHIHLYLLGTIQFRHALSEIRDQILQKYQHATGSTTITTTLTISIPQCKPLSPGEVLGCTSPILNHHSQPPPPPPQDLLDMDGTTPVAITTKAMVCFIADGRFHLESTMIANHAVIDTFYRYDPYSRILSIEQYGKYLDNICS